MKVRFRVAVRFLGSLLAVTGALLLADVAITLAWQEPVSALMTRRAQSRLNDELVTVERRLRPPRPVAHQAWDARLLAERYRRGLRRGIRWDGSSCRRWTAGTC